MPHPLLCLVQQQRCARTLDYHCYSKDPLLARCAAQCTPPCSTLFTNSHVKGHLITNGPSPTRCIALCRPHAPNSSMHSVIHQVGGWHCGIPFPRKDTCLSLLSPLFAQGLLPHPVCSTVDTSVRTLVCRTGVGTRRLFWTVRIMDPCGPLSCTLCFALQRQINRICTQV